MLFNVSLKYISPIPYLVVLPLYRLLGPKMDKNRPSGHSKQQFWWFLIQLGRIWDKTRPSCITEQSFDEAPCPANTAADHSIKCLQAQSEGLQTLDCACRKNCIRITDQFTDRLLHRNWRLYMSIHILLQLKLPYLERLVLPDSVFFGSGAFCKLDSGVGTRKCLDVHPRSWFPVILTIFQYRRYKFQYIYVPTLFWDIE